MREAPTSVPLSVRPRDAFFVVFFSLFAFSSFFSDAWHGLGLLDDTTFWGRANLWYCRIAGDDFLAADHAFPRLNRKDGSDRRHTHAILVFEEPVRGPILIGAGRYRGYGLCRALEMES